MKMFLTVGVLATIALISGCERNWIYDFQVNVEVKDEGVGKKLAESQVKLLAYSSTFDFQDDAAMQGAAFGHDLTAYGLPLETEATFTRAGGVLSVVFHNANDFSSFVRSFYPKPWLRLDMPQSHHEYYVSLHSDKEMIWVKRERATVDGDIRPMHGAMLIVYTPATIAVAKKELIGSIDSYKTCVVITTTIPYWAEGFLDD
jgi:hypothetical protein